MEFFKPGKVYDFMGQSRRWLIISGVACTLAIASFIYPGPNWGTDFAGGTEMQLTFEKPVTNEQLRRTMTSIGYPHAEVVSVGGRASSYIIRVKEVTQITPAQSKAAKQRVWSDLRAQKPFVFKLSQGGDKLAVQFREDVTPERLQEVLEAARLDVRSVRRFGRPEDHRFEVELVGIGDAIMRGLTSKLGADKVPDQPERVEWVGPKAGAQLRDAGIRAILYALALMAIYIAFRFDLRFAPGAVVAIFHDVVIGVGVLVFAGRELTLTTVAAVLTIVGYSINDCIVVFDRIRENFTKMRERDLAKTINTSVSETLGRTVNTVLTTQFTVIAIFVFTSGQVADFALCLFVGFFVGAYSSIFIAGPITVWFDRKVFRRGQT